jgi:isoleucyl-tRNA synthetase
MVLTHGFVLDEHGRKMSKSLGNTVAPQDVIKQSGADIPSGWRPPTMRKTPARQGNQDQRGSLPQAAHTMRYILGASKACRIGNRFTTWI